MNRKLADTITLDFTVHLPTTGAVSDADSTPTVDVFEDDTDTTLSGASVTKRTGKTGNYRVAIVATTVNGFEVGKSYNVIVTVVAGGVTAKAVIGSFSIDSKRLADLNDIAAGAAMILTGAYDAAKIAAPESGGNLAAVKTQTDRLAFSVINQVDVNVIDWKGAAAPAMTGDAFARLGAAGAGLTALGDTRIAHLDAQISTRSTLTAQQVWECATRTLSSFGTLAADVWNSVTRTLTSGTRDSQIDVIKAKTDNLPADPASNTQVNTRLATASYTTPDNAGIGAIKAKTDNLPASPASEANVQGHMADALAAYDPPTQAELTAAVAPLALEAEIEAHVLAALNSYDPPTRADATLDKTAILAAVAALNNLTVGEILGGDLSDNLSFPANSLADLVRKLFWVLCNRLAITDTGVFTAYKTDGVTPAAAGIITDNGATTARSNLTWP